MGLTCTERGPQGPQICRMRLPELRRGVSRVARTSAAHMVGFTRPTGSIGRQRVSFASVTRELLVAATLALMVSGCGHSADTVSAHSSQVAASAHADAGNAADW